MSDQIPTEELAPQPTPENTNPVDITKVYDAIKSFVDDLFAVFGGDKPTPLALYHRVLQKIQPTDTNRIERVVGGFGEFCSKHSSLLLKTEDKFPADIVIQFLGSPKIYIQISTFINQSDGDTRNVIFSHLLAISSMLEKDTERAKELSAKYAETTSASSGAFGGMQDIMKKVGIDSSTEEGKYVENIMSKVDSAVKGMNGMDMSDPMAMIGNLMSNGALTDLFSLGSAPADGSAPPDPKKLMKVFKTILNNMIPDE